MPVTTTRSKHSDERARALVPGPDGPRCFYSDNFIALWQRTLRSIGGTISNVGDDARLFALAEMAATDAIISAWDTKKFYNFWRPLTAIQQGAADGNRQTDGDPNWVPFLVMPPYPEYTSGANALTGL